VVLRAYLDAIRIVCRILRGVGQVLAFSAVINRMRALGALNKGGEVNAERS
jgi:hypothetical protein